jgi:tetratricopeptide (TPR) repeat protein
MRVSRFFLSLLVPFLAPVLLFPQEKQRDLRLDKGTDSSTSIPLSGATAPAGFSIPRGYALIIGISEYQHLAAQFQLQYPSRDAESIYSVLISQQGGSFRAQNVHKLIGKEATLANMRRELEEWLPSVAGEDDTVLIYFAGHGFIFEGKGYLAPHDFRTDNIPGTGYPMASLGAVVGSKIKAKNKVLLTDACHSGAITPGADTQNVSSALLNLNRSVFSLTASRDREQSFESPDWGGGHGIFTYYVVKGLEGEADENRDARVTADELAEYARRNVRDATGGKQNPTSDRGSFDPNLLLSFVPRNQMVNAASLSKLEYGTLIFESNLEGVEVFVDGESKGIMNKGTPLRIPGLRPGVHTVKGVKMGFEPDGPREEMVYPGQESTVTMKILIPRRRNKAAAEAFEKGEEYYNKGYAQNYKKAAEFFLKAFSVDPLYSQAALFLARTYNALYEEEKAKTYFRRAIEVDPDYMEARASYGGMLLDIGDVDESIRQLTVVIQREPNHPTAHYLLAQAFRMKDSYAESIRAAQEAIRINPRNAEARFWLAESLRMSGNCERAVQEYQEYLRLSDFESKLAGKMNYYVLGFLIGMGKKKRAAQEDIWKDLRSLAYFGLGDCQRLLKKSDPAIEFYSKSLSFDPEDPQVHFGLGLALVQKAELTQSASTLPEARRHFQTMLEINPDLPQADRARKYMTLIDQTLQPVKR